MAIKNRCIFAIFRFVLMLLVVSFISSQHQLVRAGESLQESAKSGDVAAQFKLGQSYKSNAQSLDDFKRAYSWTKKAADQDMGEAQFSLADMYCSGSGVTQSYVYAYVYHYLAARNGVVAAEGKMEILEQLFLTPDDIREALKIAAEIENKKEE